MTRPALNRIWASGSDSEIKDPGTEKYTEGWEAEIPTYQVLNFLQNKVDKTLLSLGERGVFEWGSDVTYQKNALAWNSTDGKIYLSLVASPDKSLSPDKNPSQWEASSIQITRTEFDKLNSDITTHINYLGGTNPHKLQPHDVDTYSRAEIDAMVGEDSEANSAHIADMNNPHKTTAAQAGGVPKSGGEYTGKVVMGTGELDLDLSGNGKVTSGTAGIILGIDNNGLGVNPDGEASLVSDGVFTPLGTAAIHDASDFLPSNYTAPVTSVNGETGEVNLDAGDVGAVAKTGDTMSGTLKVNAEIQTSSSNSYRMVSGDYGTFWRQDGTTLYLMLTNAGDQYGAYNDFRPLIVDLTTGVVTLPGGTSVNGLLHANEVNAGGARFTNDGNIFGSMWGNDWLSNYINSHLAKNPNVEGVGGVGTYAFCSYKYASIIPNQLVSGSDLFISGVGAQQSSSGWGDKSLIIDQNGTLLGTWMCCGAQPGPSGDDIGATLYFRIA